MRIHNASSTTLIRCSERVPFVDYIINRSHSSEPEPIRIQQPQSDSLLPTQILKAAYLLDRQRAFPMKADRAERLRAPEDERLPLARFDKRAESY